MTQTHSSIGQSNGFLIRRFKVRILVGLIMITAKSLQEKDSISYFYVSDKPYIVDKYYYIPVKFGSKNYKSMDVLVGGLQFCAEFLVAITNLTPADIVVYYSRKTGRSLDEAYNIKTQKTFAEIEAIVNNAVLEAIQNKTLIKTCCIERSKGKNKYYQAKMRLWNE